VERNQVLITCHRPRGLDVALLCVCLLAGTARAQQPPARDRNPFEAVGSAAEPAAPQPQQPQPQPGAAPPSPFEAPRAAEEAPPTAAAQDVIEAIEFRGLRRIPQDTVRNIIYTKKGDKVDPDAIHRDYMAIWNMARFDDIRTELEPGKTGQILRFVLTEKPYVRSVTYPGVKSLTVSEILDRFKERKIGSMIESVYDPSKVQRAKVVLEEYLGERGRQFAKVVPEVRPLPPSSLSVAFRVDEGPKVKVGTIDIQGAKAFRQRAVVRAMRNLRPIGVPHSIVAENIFSKAYDSTKLEEDMERIRDFYMTRGYFRARVVDHQVSIHDVGGGKFRVPLIYMNPRGKRANVAVQVEEGVLYRLNKMNFVGMKLFKAPDALGQEIFKMRPGDVFSTEKLRKGVTEMQKLYGNYGYIDAALDPDFDFPPNTTGKLDLILNVDEGKQFWVRRIDFSGNTTTRDKVIRREMMLAEGEVYSQRAWEVSILRLNQLGYFETLKEKEAADIKRDTRTNTVDITLKVKERGKNSVGMQAGVSGVAGSFVGFNYETNNFLGLGETLSLQSQFGDRIRSGTFGFTEPYFLDRPISVGFTVYMQRFNFDQGREVSLLSGRNYMPIYAGMDPQSLFNYTSNGYGFTVFASYPMKRTFARLGLTYGYDTSKYTPLTDSAKASFDYMNFQNLGGPNSLTGIKTSKIVPSYTYNTVDHPITPTRGKSLFVSTEFAGSFMGGNVNMIRPTISSTYFRHGFMKGHVIGMRGMVSLVTGYGGKQTPPFNRFYMGGEQDIRGFEIWTISPIVWMPSQTQVKVLNDDGSSRTQKVITDGVVTYSQVLQTIPFYQFTMPGGDTQLVGNFEYRIPIVGPVTLAGFFDAGANKILFPKQLTLNPDRVTQLNSQFPQAGFSGRALIEKGTQQMRSSVGVELQIMMPVVNAPFRLYWAYNPQIIPPHYLYAPIAADRSLFPNYATYVGSVGAPAQLMYEKRRTIRFTIGRTF
jgi:outer membrane protein insertion porin family